MLAVVEHAGDFPLFAEVVLHFDGGEVDLLVAAVHVFDEVVQGVEGGAEVEVVQKGVFLVSHIDEGGVESAHHFVHFTEVDVADGEGAFGLLAVEFDELPVFEEGDLDLAAGRVDD